MESDRCKFRDGYLTDLSEHRTPNTEVGRAAGFIALKASGGMQKQADAAKKVKNHICRTFYCRSW